MTTINDFPALPASEETSDFSRDVSFASALGVCLGDKVRVQSGPFAFLTGEVWWKRDDTVEVRLSVFGMETIQPFHWTNLKRVV